MICASRFGSRNIQSKKGYSLVELVLVLCLLLLVSSLVFTLIGAGSQAWLRLSSAQNQRSDLRTGLSYVDMQIRKMDRVSAVTLTKDPFQGTPALLLTGRIEQPTIAGQDQYQLWIYVADGLLCELYAASGQDLQPGYAQAIVAMKSMQVTEISNQLFEISLTSQSYAQADSLSDTRIIHLRSEEVIP